MLRKFQISSNRSLDGVVDFLNSKNMTEGGSLEAVDDDDERDQEVIADNRNRQKAVLPGVAKGGNHFFVKKIITFF